MAVLYRSIVTDEVPGLLARTEQALADWLAGKDFPEELPPKGTVAAGDRSVTIRRGEQEGLRALRLQLDEDYPEEHWRTTFTAVEEGVAQWLWTDVEHGSEDAYSRVRYPAPPRAVRELIAEGDCSTGGVPLPGRPIEASAQEVDTLIGLLNEPQRSAPVVVLGYDHQVDASVNYERADALDRKLQGVAPVWLLHAGAVYEFARCLGEDLAVRNGSARTYLPGMDPADPDPRRHRFLSRERFSGSLHKAAGMVGEPLLRRATLQRPPAVYYRRVVTLPEFKRTTDDEPGEEWLDALAEIEEDRDQAYAERDGAVEERDLAYLEQAEVQRELEVKERETRLLCQRLAEFGDQQVWALAEEIEPPEEVDTCIGAIELARKHCDLVVVSDSDEHANHLDTFPQAPAWAAKAWRALRALQAFAEVRRNGFQGDLTAFCTSQPPGAHPVVPVSWVARGENQTVENTDKYRRARTFPVPKRVNPSGEAYMGWHIRLDKGKDPAPRIHLLDDTGATGQVYVGYLGRHLPSPKTN